MDAKLQTERRIFPGWRWVLVALAIPVAGLIGGAISGPVDAPLAALIGGVLTGAGIGAVQWLVAKDAFGDGRIWIATSALAYGVGLLVGAAVVGYNTDIGSLAAMGAISGLVLGAAQGIALAEQGRKRLALAWGVAMPVLLAIGWSITTLGGIDVDQQFTVFGAFGRDRVHASQRAALGAVLAFLGTGRLSRIRSSSLAEQKAHEHTESWPGSLLIAMPIAFNVSFTLLGARFDYPDILRRPTDEILERFRQGGTTLVLIWWAFALTAVLFAPLVVLLSAAIADADATLLALATTVGVLAAVVQFLGLIRWPFLVPYLAREAEKAAPGSPRQEAVDIVFQSFNRYLGVARRAPRLRLDGAWSLGRRTHPDGSVPAWVGVPGIVVGATLLLCSLDFVGRHEASGWKLAETLTPIA